MDAPTAQPPARRKARELRQVAVSKRIERRTFRQAAFASAGEGMTAGLLSLNAYVAVTAFGAMEAGIQREVSTLVTMLPAIAMLFATAYDSGPAVKGRRRYFLFAAVFGRLVFALVPLLVFLPHVTSTFAFVALVAFSALVCAGVPPALNQLWGANYIPASRGRRFAWNSSLSMLMVLTGAFVAGIVLDSRPLVGDHGNHVVLYPAAAVVGALALLGFYAIRLRHSPGAYPRRVRGFWPRLKDSYARAFGLLRHDKHFRTYELGFFIYGIAFMMVMPAIPIMFAMYLEADYGDFSRATVVTMQGTLMIMAPIVAWLSSGRRVTLVTACAFGSLALFPVMLAITSLTRELWLGYLSFVVFGLAMSGVHFVWNLGALAFARGGNALAYTSTHATMVGVRALIGFPLGYLLMRAFPHTLLPVFGVASGLLVVATIILLRLDRRMVAQGLRPTA
jgi:MFS family permease